MKRSIPCRKGIFGYLYTGLRYQLSVLLLLVFAVFDTNAQLVLTNGSPTASIDFTNNMQTTVGSNPSQPFAGSGFEPNTVTAGRLNSNAWAFTGWSDGVLNYGGTRTSGDYARGATTVAVTTVAIRSA